MANVEQQIIKPNKGYPNNPKLPFLHYKNVVQDLSPEEIQKVFESNGWKNSWVDSIYTYHHFHSNTHEALGIAHGSAKLQIGGDEGPIFSVEAGDVLIIPAGVSHKNIDCTSDFTVVGSYPEDIPYDMHEGKEEERKEAEEKINQVPLPDNDPIFGKDGPLYNYWR